jgi:hypothetical protein
MASGGNAALALARALGVFRLRELAAMTGQSADQVERALRESGAAEPIAHGLWRAHPEATVPPVPPPADPALSESLVKAAARALSPLESGRVHDPQTRDLVMATARERLRLALLSANGDAEARARVDKLQRRFDRIADRPPMDDKHLFARLQDWTEALEDDAEDGTFDLEASLREATSRADDPGAVFAPALAASAAGLGTDEERLTLAAELDHRMRTAAIGARVFDVLALGCVAAVTGAGKLADPLMSALTTPGFAAAADRTARRIGYAALASLARPGADTTERAAEACHYLLRREPPGRDEMELLAPAALRSEQADGAAALTLVARWLNWEAERRGAKPAPDTNFLGELDHVARNLGCALALGRYDKLERGLHHLADDELGVVLVALLGSKLNDALFLDVADPSFGVEPRKRVADATGLHRPRRPLSIQPATRVGQFLQERRVHDLPPARRGEFSRLLSKRGRHA